MFVMVASVATRFATVASVAARFATLVFSCSSIVGVPQLEGWKTLIGVAKRETSEPPDLSATSAVLERKEASGLAPGHDETSSNT